MKFRSAIIIILLSVNQVLSQLTPDETSKKERIESLMKVLSERDKFTGTLLVSESGNVLFEKSYGYSNPEGDEVLNKNSMYLLASVTKQFTAMGIMLLKEKGLLSYNDTVEKHIPEFPFSKITIEQLLHHTSGLPDYEIVFHQYWDKSRVANNRDLIEILKKNKPELKNMPGEKFSYSNTGYALLASIIEKVSHLAYSDFMRRHIFEKLQMTNTEVITGTGDNNNYKIVEGRAFSFDEGKYVLPEKIPGNEYITYLRGIVGDVGIYSTAEDLHKWDIALYSENLVKQETLKEAFEPGILLNGNKTNYGFGWSIFNYYGANAMIHTGGLSGSYSLILRVPEKRRTIIILCINQSFLNIWESIYKILNGDTPEKLLCRADLFIINNLFNKRPDEFKEGIDRILAEAGDYGFNEILINDIGMELLKINRIDEAIEVLKLNAAVFASSAEVYYNLARAYSSAGKKEMAVMNYKTALQINSGHKKALAELEKEK